MDWIKVAVGFARHPKIRAISDAALRLHIEAMCYCGEYRTDGVLADPSVIPSSRGELIKQLVDNRLWEKYGSGYLVHDWLDHQLSKEQITARRAGFRERQAKRRERCHGVSHASCHTTKSKEVEVEREKEREEEEPPRKPPQGGAGLASWFRDAWNDMAPALPAIRRLSGSRVRSVAAMLSAAGGDRNAVERAIAAFGSWEFAVLRRLGVDTFLRANTRDKYLEWGESGPPVELNRAQAQNLKNDGEMLKWLAGGDGDG